MHLSCDCLNVLITSKNSVFSEVDTKFSDTFTNDKFFKECIGLLSLCSINIQVPSLVTERDSGQWRIVFCLNCGKSCYSTSKALGTGSIVARKDLQVDTNKINRLKQSEHYSPIFGILIYESDTSDDETVMEKTSLYPAAISWLTEQAAITEERVKDFSDKEYAALDELRQRAYREQRAINRREKACAKELVKEVAVDDLNQKFERTSIIEKKKPLVPKSSFGDSFDTEGVFLLDGFEDNADPDTNDELDLEGFDDLATYQPRRMGAAQLAKSLPIPVPQFMESDSKQHNDPLDGSPDVPTDIAASMKALAKSIHGEAVFGELPPPRFSTHL